MQIGVMYKTVDRVDSSLDSRAAIANKDPTPFPLSETVFAVLEKCR